MTVPRAFTASLSPDERAAYGRKARRRAPRSSHGWYETAQQRPDPLEVVERQSAERVAELVPIRYGRMLEPDRDTLTGLPSVRQLAHLHDPKSQ
jgi:hypothetical protein